VSKMIQRSDSRSTYHHFWNTTVQTCVDLS